MPVQPLVFAYSLYSDVNCPYFPWRLTKPKTQQSPDE